MEACSTSLPPPLRANCCVTSWFMICTAFCHLVAKSRTMGTACCGPKWGMHCPSGTLSRFCCCSAFFTKPSNIGKCAISWSSTYRWMQCASWSSHSFNASMPILPMPGCNAGDKLAARLTACWCACCNTCLMCAWLTIRKMMPMRRSRNMLLVRSSKSNTAAHSLSSMSVQACGRKASCSSVSNLDSSNIMDEASTAYRLTMV
mmetsp:Transcript_23537/g.64883  ORF Transcript_23537/g.64883 Transcript_23537/m.64883 type:complete len:203 (-) Transcript_23537:1648-2256(-)